MPRCANTSACGPRRGSHDSRTDRTEPRGVLRVDGIRVGVLQRWESGMVVPNASSEPTDFSSQVPRQCRTAAEEGGRYRSRSAVWPASGCGSERLGLPKLAMMSGSGLGRRSGCWLSVMRRAMGTESQVPKAGPGAHGRSMMPEPQSTRLWGGSCQILRSVSAGSWAPVGFSAAQEGSCQILRSTSAGYRRRHREPCGPARPLRVRARKLRIGASATLGQQGSYLSPMQEVIWF